MAGWLGRPTSSHPHARVPTYVNACQELEQELLILLVGNNRGFNVQEREREKIDEAIQLLVRGGTWMCVSVGGGGCVLVGLLPTYIISYRSPRVPSNMGCPPPTIPQMAHTRNQPQNRINDPQNPQEAENPNPRPTEGFEARNSPLTGDWRLIYTNAIDVLLLGLLPTGKRDGVCGFLELSGGFESFGGG